MYVYIKCGKEVRRFQNVVLWDCYQPRVDEVSVEKIEPALWFKVLILDSLLVDCDGRDVYWNKNTCIEAETFHASKVEELNVNEILPFFEGKGNQVTYLWSVGGAFGHIHVQLWAYIF